MKQYPSIPWEGRRKTTETLSQDSLGLCRDSNRIPSEHNFKRYHQSYNKQVGVIVVSLVPTVDLIENTQKYYEIHSVLLPMYTVAIIDKAMCKCCGKVVLGVI